MDSVEAKLVIRYLCNMLGIFLKYITLFWVDFKKVLMGFSDIKLSLLQSLLLAFDWY